MEYLKLSNNTTYELVTNGVQEVNDNTVKYVFLPGEKTFDNVENDFNQSTNVETVYVLDSKKEPIRSIKGFTNYKSLEKVKDYVISSEMTNTGTEEEPVYEEVNNIETVMIVTMAKSDLESRIAYLEAQLASLMQIATILNSDDENSIK